MKSDIFFSGTIAIITGMVLGMIIPKHEIFDHWWMMIVGIMLWSFLVQKLFRSNRFLLVMIVSGIFLTLGFLRTDLFHKQYPFDLWYEYHDEPITLVGNVQSQPEFKPGNQAIQIYPETINGQKITGHRKSIVLRTSDLYTFKPGDTVIATGTFQIRRDFVSDTGRTVHYQLMSYSKKIAGDIRYPTIVDHIPATQNISGVLVTVKKKFLDTLHQLFFAPAGGLLAGMMIGDTSSLDGAFLEVFRLVGLIHIVVLSGYNITLIANAFVKTFSPFGYYRRLVFAMIAIVLFIIMVGISQTALRAGIMALCVFSAAYFLRPYAILRALLIALMIMALVSPYALLFDLSLQLSFLATIGIAFVFPILQTRFPKIAQSNLGEIFLQTLGVNLFVLPMILYQIGYFSLVSFPMNVLVLGFVPLLTIGGFLVTLLGMIAFPLAQVFAVPIQVVTDLIIKFSVWTSAHDPFQTRVPQFPLWLLITLYILLIVWLIRFSLRNRTNNKSDFALRGY